MNNGNMQFYTIDIMKLILAVLIVSIHVPVSDNPQICDFFNLINIFAVPVFFIYTSFLFYNRNNKIRMYVRRMVYLYFAWFIILIPFTIIIKDYTVNNIFSCLLQDILFNNTFPNSWFLSASIISVSIFDSILKCKGGKYINLGLAVACLLVSNDVFPEFSHLWNSLTNGYTSVSFLAAYPYIAIGYLLYKYEKSCHKRIQIKPICLILYTITCFLMLFIVYNSTDKSYWIRLIGSVVITIISLRLEVSLPKSFIDNIKKIRSCSIVMYLSHAPIGVCLLPLINSKLQIDLDSTIIFITTVFLCIGITLFILHFEKNFKLLKHLH